MYVHRSLGNPLLSQMFPYYYHYYYYYYYYYSYIHTYNERVLACQSMQKPRRRRRKNRPASQPANPLLFFFSSSSLCKLFELASFLVVLISSLSPTSHIKFLLGREMKVMAACLPACLPARYDIEANIIVRACATRTSLYFDIKKGGVWQDTRKCAKK